MTPDQAKEIVRRMLERVSPQQLEWWGREIVEQEAALRRARWLRFQALVAKLAPFILLILLVILLLLVIRGCSELRSTVATPVPSGLTCASDGRDRIFHHIQVSTWRGCRASMNEAFQQAEQRCAGLADACTGAGACGTGRCAPGVVVRELEHTGGWFSCDTFVGFTCDCGCRP